MQIDGQADAMLEQQVEIRTTNECRTDRMYARTQMEMDAPLLSLDLTPNRAGFEWMACSGELPFFIVEFPSRFTNCTICIQRHSGCRALNGKLQPVAPCSLMNRFKRCCIFFCKEQIFCLE